MRRIVPGVVLAAGRSSRMGRPKALLPVGPAGETFAARTVRTLCAGGVDEVVVVVADPASPAARAVLEAHPPLRLVVNPAPERGQFSSLQAGLRAIDRPGVAGMLVTLVDLPLVSAAAVKALLDVHGATRAPVVRPVRGDGRHGHPVVFDRSVFDAIRRAPIGSSAKAIVRAHARDAIDVPIAEEGPFRDIDTPSDYEQAFGRPPAPGGRR